MSKITLIKPDAGQTAQCAMQHGRVYVFGFDSTDAIFDRLDGALKISFDDGSTLLLQDFYRETLIADLFLELPDGARVSGRELVEAMELVPEDFQTDIGPAVAVEPMDFHHHPVIAPIPLVQAESGVSSSILQAGASAASSSPLFQDLEFRSYPQLLADRSVSGKDDLHPDQHLGGTVFFPGKEDTAFSAPTDDDPVFSAFFQVPSARCDFSSEIKPESGPETHLVPFHEGLMAKGSLTPQSSADTGRFFPSEQKSAGLIVLEDLLDTSLQEIAAAKHSSTFVDIFQPSPDEGIYLRSTGCSLSELELNTMGSEPVDDASSDQLLLAFINMGSM